MIWYSDDKIKIEFSHKPLVDILDITPNMPIEEIENIIKKPFINLSDFIVKIYDYRGVITNYYEFVIHRRYRWDGASIPKQVWSLIGMSNTSVEFLIPSLIHDVLCENHHYVNNDRYLSTLVLERLLCVNRVPKIKRWLIKHTVDNFQKLLWRK